MISLMLTVICISYSELTLYFQFSCLDRTHLLDPVPLLILIVSLTH